MSDAPAPKKSIPAEVQLKIISSRASGAAILAREFNLDVAQVQEVLDRSRKKGSRR